MSIVEEVERNPDIHTVWISEETRIASFRAVIGYQKHDYSNHSFFMAFLHSL